MNNFLLAKDPNDPQTQLIIKTNFPSIVAKVIQFANKSHRDDFIAAKQANDRFIGSVIYGYNIVVVPNGHLPVDMPWNEPERNIYEHMAQFFYERQLLDKPRIYRNLINDEI